MSGSSKRVFCIVALAIICTIRELAIGLFVSARTAGWKVVFLVVFEIVAARRAFPSMLLYARKVACALFAFGIYLQAVLAGLRLA